MSHVTDTFFLTSVSFDPEYDEEDKATLAKIDAWFEEHLTRQRFKRLDTNKTAYGGGKMMQANVWVGAFNYIDYQELIWELKHMDFKGWAQFLYQDEHDDGFTLVQIQADTEGSDLLTEDSKPSAGHEEAQGTTNLSEESR